MRRLFGNATRGGAFWEVDVTATPAEMGRLAEHLAEQGVSFELTPHAGGDFTVTVRVNNLGTLSRWLANEEGDRS